MNTTIHLNFNFRNNWYHATVSMLHKGTDQWLLVRFFDKTVHTILSRKELLFHWSHGLHCPLLQVLDDRGNELIATVKEAVLESFIRPAPVETAIGNYRGL